jgi:cyclopropane-fatty-acyl-phospholipid synthase
MTQIRTAKTTNAAAKLVVLAVLEDLFGPSGRSFALRFWNGTVEVSKASYESRFTLVLKRPAALRRMLLPPTELALGEAYLHDDFDVEGNLEEATELGDFFSTRLRSPTRLVAIVCSGGGNSSRRVLPKV